MANKPKPEPVEINYRALEADMNSHLSSKELAATPNLDKTFRKKYADDAKCKQHDAAKKIGELAMGNPDIENILLKGRTKVYLHQFADGRVVLNHEAMGIDITAGIGSWMSLSRR